jgi:kumamolisin
MAPKENRIPIRGSERDVPPDATAAGPADPNEHIRVTVSLRHRPAPGAFPAVDQMATLLPAERLHLTRAEFAAAHGADPADIAKVRAFAAAHGLEVAEEHPERRSVVLAGTVAALSAAFDVHLERYEHPQGTFRGRTGPVHVPEELQGIVEGIFGLDNRPQCEPHFRFVDSHAAAVQPHGSLQSYTVPELAQLYRFPADADGSGQCIAILEMGGGYQSEDLDQFFTNEIGFSRPEVVDIGVDGTSNRPDDSQGSGETTLDIEIAGAVAPGAKIAVYFAPNTDQGFLDALNSAIHDSTNNPSVISISWGAAEVRWTGQLLKAFNSTCRDAAALGITICAASGDRGFTDGIIDQQPHVDFPASSPYVLGCGGTQLQSADGQITSETVWNSGPAETTGGGVSRHFPLPAWQRAANVPLGPNQKPGRGVPDVAGNAARQTGYRIVFNGNSLTAGGTSAVAPLWAGLIARLNQRIGKPVGFLNPLLYAKLPRDFLNDITSGSNGFYQARQDWDPCTGLGSPNGAKLLAALHPPASAGHP